MFHGCTVKDNVLIGMGAILMDDCMIDENSIIAAGALLSTRTVVEPGSVYAGIPAKKIQDADPKLVEGEINRIANNYIKYASWYK